MLVSKVQWRILAVVVVAVFIVSTMMTRPTIYVDDWGKCVVADVENPKSGKKCKGCHVKV